jgi:hypothetical protein
MPVGAHWNPSLSSVRFDWATINKSLVKPLRLQPGKPPLGGLQDEILKTYFMFEDLIKKVQGYT